LRRPEQLVLNPELAGSRTGDVLPRAMQHVDDFAAVVEQRLEDFLHPCVVRCFLRAEAHDREHFAGRRDGPLNELSPRLLKVKCAKELRRERQRSASAGGDSKELATIHHEGFKVGVPALGAVHDVSYFVTEKATWVYSGIGVIQCAAQVRDPALLLGTIAEI
jgi:hypothetical protein